MSLIIGSRGSDLALWQANHIRGLLEQKGIVAEIKIIKTQGDRIQDIGFDKMEGKGFFTKELEEALLKKEIDIAVHSHKDLPTEMPGGLTIAAVSGREDPAELLIVHREAVDEKRRWSLKLNAVVGTSSARRKSQLRAFRNDVAVLDLRGNVPTRVQKLREKKYDAILIAAAGVERLELDLSDLVVNRLDPHEFVPAPAQGVLAIQVRASDKKLIGQLQAIHDEETREIIEVERRVLNLFHGGCQLPLGVLCEKDEEGAFKVHVSKAEAWDKAPVRLFLRSEKAEELPHRIVSRIRSVRPASVFITRDLRPHDFFSNVLTGNGFTVNGRHLIETKKVPVKEIPKTDWVFFSSKNGVKFYFGHKPQDEGVRYAVVGKATAEALRKFGKRAEFIGYSVDTKLTGKQFAAKAGKATVLFPQAKGSMRSIQQQFVNPKQVIDLVVYETLKKNDQPVPAFDIIVFTSPSNAEAFFEKNNLEKNKKVVAMGGSTAHVLKQQFGIKSLWLPESFDEAGLAEAVFAASSKEENE